MKKITLIGSKLAKMGNEFVYMGILEECETCKFKRICHDNLEVGRRYKIVSVRSANHQCKIHEDGVKVVEVVPAEFVIMVEAKKALEGVTLTHNPINCENVFCENYIYCNPEGIDEGDRYKILSVMNEKIKCEKGRSLRKVVITLEK
ncbi:UPF0179 family protein [Methanotorris formicicus]|uniref:UPF0179 protein MetfoDRAFT_1538 n=1 Tax=Methanotorris formicicus Mc-S-70 TaxID=647171 RepID=H1L0G4_9EURY|nr:UPF0179 family protein [Methanotorris formicicus]EHP84887.1 protein of unknown function UPF0179 [Methanotorris formicicus Mc-S-70]